MEEGIGPLEPPYKSRGEAQMGRLLDRYELPFFYEQPTLIYDRGRHHIWHPDFTPPQYNGLVVEYAALRRPEPGRMPGMEKNMPRPEVDQISLQSPDLEPRRARA